MDNPRVLYIGNDEGYKIRGECDKTHIPFTFTSSVASGLELLAAEWDLIIIEKEVYAEERFINEILTFNKHFPTHAPDRLGSAIYLLSRIREKDALNKKTEVIIILPHLEKEDTIVSNFKAIAKQYGVSAFYYLSETWANGYNPGDEVSKIAVDISKLLLGKQSK